MTAWFGGKPSKERTAQMWAVVGGVTMSNPEVSFNGGLRLLR